MKMREMLIPKTVYVGRRTIVKEGTQGAYKVYLPRALDTLWKELRGKKVDVYIVIPNNEGEER